MDNITVLLTKLGINRAKACPDSSCARFLDVSNNNTIPLAAELDETDGSLYIRDIDTYVYPYAIDIYLTVVTGSKELVEKSEESARRAEIDEKIKKLERELLDNAMRIAGQISELKTELGML